MSEDEKCSKSPLEATQKFKNNTETVSSKYYEQNEDSECFPYSVDYIEGVGRVIRATRDITPGEIIFREKEMVIGPSRNIPPVCLGCGRRVNGLVKCPGCQWPLCSHNCQELYLHSPEECKIIAPSGKNIGNSNESAEKCNLYQVCLITDVTFSEIFCMAGNKSSFLQAIMPLRVLQLPEKDLQYLLQFMDHSDHRNMEETEDLVVKRIREEWGQTQYSPELIRKVDGILDVNTVEHR